MTMNLTHAIAGLSLSVIVLTGVGFAAEPAEVRSGARIKPVKSFERTFKMSPG